MTEIDLDALEAFANAQLVQCGPCDFGLVEYGCTCPQGDPRPVISQLVELIAEVRTLRTQLAEAKGRECTALCRDIEEDRDALLPVVEAARAWRRWYPHVDSMFAPENTLIGTVDAFEAEN